MNKYEEEAKKFLADTGTTLEVVKAIHQTAPLWAKKGEKHGINYTVTLKNKNAIYTFDFWNSIVKAELLQFAKDCKTMGNTNNKKGDTVLKFLEDKGIVTGALRIQTSRLIETVEKAIMPTTYDILACLSPLYEDDFHDFCCSFGYEEDSIIALKTFEACKEQDRMLRKLFNQSELSKLEEIQ